MTLIKGAYFKGLRIEGKKSFASIPGLIMWCEADYGVTLSGSDIVSIADRSGFNNEIVGLYEENRGQLVTISGTFKAMQNSGIKYSNIVNPAAKGWNAIIKQRPFGIFTLVSRNQNPNSVFILRHNYMEPNEMWFFISSTGSARHIFSNSNNNRINWGSANNVVSSDNTIHAVDLVCYGTGNNPLLQLFVNTSSVATRATSNLTGSETVTSDFYVLENPNVNAISQLVMLLVYDWTGYSVAQINSFRQQVNNLREEKYGSIF
jgi:hypothetical protein